MEVENPASITFEKLLSNYPSLNQIGIEQISKAIDKKITVEVLPPFITVHLDSKDEPEIGFDELLQIWDRYMNKAFPADVIKLEDNNIFYITRYEESLMIAKNQEDDALFFIGKFAVGEIVLFSYAKASAEKITRLKLLMNLYNAIVQKVKQTEKPDKPEKKK